MGRTGVSGSEDRERELTPTSGSPDRHANIETILNYCQGHTLHYLTHTYYNWTGYMAVKYE